MAAAVYRAHGVVDFQRVAAGELFDAGDACAFEVADDCFADVHQVGQVRGCAYASGGCHSAIVADGRRTCLEGFGHARQDDVKCQRGRGGVVRRVLVWSGP